MILGQLKISTSNEKCTPSVYTVYIVYIAFAAHTAYAVFTVYTVYTIQTALHSLNSCMHTYIYCYEERAFLEYGSIGFWAN